MKNNFLLIDYGNTNIKAAIYNLKQKRCLEFCTVPSKTSAIKMLKHFKKANIQSIKRIVISVTPKNKDVDLFNKNVKAMLKVPLTIVGKKEFKDFIDLSNISPKVFIGSDIYSCALQAIEQFKEPSLIVSLGTAYFAIVVKNKQIHSAYLLPSIAYGFDTISKITAIPDALIPKMYDKEKGLDTLSSFAAGANTCIEGFVDNIAKINKVKKQNVILTGGDVFRFKNIRKKYKEIKNYVLYGLATLVKQKHW